MRVGLLSGIFGAFPQGQQSLPGFNVELEPDNQNVAALLAKAGYATGMVGNFM